jgi:AcrR family transcriptional regulator
MYANFLKLDKEKQERIINAGLSVFSKKPYKSASTDDIVDQAGISKGALYHYFKNKKNFFLYLYDYVTQMMITNFSEKVDFEQKDIFERYKNILIVKLDLLDKHPDLYDFVINTVYGDDIELQKELNKKNREIISKNMATLLSDIDRSKFRSDIDPNVAIDMIFLTFESYGNREAIKIKQTGYSKELYDKWLNDFNRYIEVMKKIYYKGE